jgi:ribonuclease Z
MSELFKVTILGSSAATPTSLRHTTAQLLQHHNRRYLLDCAEGTQIQLRRLKVPLMKINHIFISHLHGDHYLGLPGLLFTLHLLGRKNELHVYSPPGLEEIIRLQYKISELTPSFEVLFHELRQGEEMIYEDSKLTVHTIPMKHRITTYGFLFREKEKERNIKKSLINKHDIPIEAIPGIKKGLDFVTVNGKTILNSELTMPPPLPRSYAFCSDTAYTEDFIEQVRGVDLLYHEATFLQDKAEVAHEKTHSTAIEAATIAKKADAKKLLLGHYSARYKDMSAFKNEARTVFPNTFLAEEGEEFSI